jgi:hypothetical protein
MPRKYHPTEYRDYLGREKAPCKTCGAPSAFHGATECTNCYEVEGRLAQYIDGGPKAVAFVKEALATLIKTTAMSNDKVYDRCVAANAEVRSGPHGWIQWKGTDVCMDVRCSCGESTHIDSDFTYVIQCGACKKFWAVAPEVRLVPITEEEAADSNPKVTLL